MFAKKTTHIDQGKRMRNCVQWAEMLPYGRCEIRQDRMQSLAIFSKGLHALKKKLVT